MPLVEAASLTNADKTFVKPEGDWYLSVGQGMGATLTVADEQQVYTLSDRATFLARTLEGIDLDRIRELIDGADEGYLPPERIQGLLDAASIPRAQEGIAKDQNSLLSLATKMRAKGLSLTAMPATWVPCM